MTTSDSKRLHTAYITGPMRGYPELNYPAFNDAAKDWRNKGYHIFNPAENYDGRSDLSLIDYMRRDLPQVMDADFLILLKGYEQSECGMLEVHLAQVLRKPMIRHPVDPRDIPDEETLQSFRDLFPTVPFKHLLPPL